MSVYRPNIDRWSLCGAHNRVGVDIFHQIDTTVSDINCSSISRPFPTAELWQQVEEFMGCCAGVRVKLSCSRPSLPNWHILQNTKWSMYAISWERENPYIYHGMSSLHVHGMFNTSEVHTIPWHVCKSLPMPIQGHINLVSWWLPFRWWPSLLVFLSTTLRVFYNS